jgi:hypothetical protein
VRRERAREKLSRFLPTAIGLDEEIEIYADVYGGAMWRSKAGVSMSESAYCTLNHELRAVKASFDSSRPQRSVGDNKFMELFAPEKWQQHEQGKSWLCSPRHSCQNPSERAKRKSLFQARFTSNEKFNEKLIIKKFRDEFAVST